MTSLSMTRTNFRSHASVYIHVSSSCSITRSNISHGSTRSDGFYINGVRGSASVVFEMCYCSFVHLNGGRSVFFENDVQSQSHHLMFYAATAKQECHIVYSESSSMHLDDCSCISSGPSIAYTIVPFKRWYFFNCSYESGSFADVASRFDDFEVTIHSFCHVIQSKNKHLLLKKLHGILLFIPFQ